MAKLKGQQIILAKWVTGAPGSYQPLVCLTNLSVNRVASEVDTSSRCDGDYSSSLSGKKKINLPVSGIAEFAPAVGSLGYDDIEALWDSGEEFDFKIYQADAGTDYTPKYGTGVLLELNDEYADDEAVKFNGSINVNGAFATVDPNA